jgi:trimeric autotransporter adhesin
MTRSSMLRITSDLGAAIASLKVGSILSTAGLLIGVVIAQPSIGQRIETVAGTGVHGYNGDNIPATTAELFQPDGVAFDSAGNMFIADAGNQLIRRVDAKTGIITTVAGSYSPTFRCDFGGDGGPADQAILCSPDFIAFDRWDNLYIADTANQRIRRVDQRTHIITTVAGNGTAGFAGDGGPATSAQLQDPNGVHFDAFGNLYIADTANDRVRRVDSHTGIISTVAGNGTGGDGGPAVDAQLGLVFDIAFDLEGNLFISDRGPNTVRRVDHRTGIITTVAGNGTLGYGGDGGPATEAELNGPVGLAFDCMGNLYIADENNSRVRRVDHRSGIITTIAGTDVNGFNGDGPAATAELNGVIALAVHKNKLYIADIGNQRVRRIEPLSCEEPKP